MNYFDHDKYFISTAIPYPNANPHIGHAFEFILTDALVRFLRLQGKDVYFVTGTDDFGLKNQQKALELYFQDHEKKDLTEEETLDIVSKYIEKTVSSFKLTLEKLNIGYNYYTSTSHDANHKIAVYKIWEKINKNGDFYEHSYSGKYCTGCESFKTEKDLVNGECPEHPGKELLDITDTDIFFKMSKYANQIYDLIESDKILVKPDYRKSETLKFIKEGLEDVSVSRSRKRLLWGLPVPNDPSRVIYVWIDALTNYITAAGYATNEDAFKEFWENRYKIHVVGKGIERFHLCIWPSMLLSAGLSTQNETFVHGFINVEGQKMSKSVGNVIDPNVLVEKYGTDAVRYWALTRSKLSEDIDFTFEKFQSVYESDLVNGLGNTLNRVLAIRKDPMNISSINPDKDHPLYEAQMRSDKLDTLSNEGFGEYNLKPLTDEVNEVLGIINLYFNASKPWEFEDNQREGIGILLGRILSKIFFALYPIIPVSSEIAFKKLATNNQVDEEILRKIDPVFVGLDPNGKKFLFEKIK